jgi:hypothetical protein
MSNVAISRRTDFAPAGKVSKNMGHIAKAASAAPVSIPKIVGHELLNALEDAAPVVTSSVAKAAGKATDALQVVAAYIPTEILTLYVAVLAALHQSGQDIRNGWFVFNVFLCATPAVVWLVFAGKIKAANKNIPWKPKQWPLWEMVAAAIAYVAWAFTLPTNPFTRLSWYSASVAGIVVLTVSIVLGLFAPIFQHSIES